MLLFLDFPRDGEVLEPSESRRDRNWTSDPFDLAQGRGEHSRTTIKTFEGDAFGTNLIAVFDTRLACCGVVPWFDPYHYSFQNGSILDSNPCPVSASLYSRSGARSGKRRCIYFTTPCDQLDSPLLLDRAQQALNARNSATNSKILICRTEYRLWHRSCSHSYNPKVWRVE